MALGFSEGERERLDRDAMAIVTAHPRVIDLIARGALLNPTGNALVYLRSATDESPVALTYDDLMGLLQAATDWFRNFGITSSDAIAILTPSCPATFVALWAGTVAGIANPLNLLFSREAIAAQLKAAGAKILFVPPPGAPGGLYEKVVGLDQEVPTLKRIVVLPLDGTVAFDGDVLRPDPAWRDKLGTATADDANRVAAMLPTGGTTGHPKITRLTNLNMVASSVGSMLSIGTTARDRALVALPLFHVGGAFVGSLSSLAAGAAIYLPTAFGMRNPEVVTQFWRILERFAITFAGLVPTSLGAVAAVPVDGADLSKLRIVATGASTCPPEIERRFLAAWGGDAVRQVYGMTEFSGAITQVPHDKSPDGAAVGLPVALAQFAVLADGQLHHGPSPMGELLARGPQVFAGYVDPRQTEAAFHDGWLRTGDLCKIEDSGQVLVTGRIKDLIIRGGHNIDPAMIEDIAMQFPGVSLAAAVGRPDSYSGEVPMLFVSATPGASIDAAALADFMNERVADSTARPKAIEIVGEIPLTPVGKIFKPRLREIAAEQAVRQVLSAHAASSAFTAQAITDPDRGLFVRVTFEGDAAATTKVTRELGLLPVATQIVGPT
ncbi:MAG: long-chain-fatty-acid--CoA ligase [Tardiphaga sp.]|nr:long-chain-fatty-acid--CoA ligase [Tardiphaga sp.]